MPNYCKLHTLPACSHLHAFVYAVPPTGNSTPLWSNWKRSPDNPLKLSSNISISSKPPLTLDNTCVAHSGEKSAPLGGLLYGDWWFEFPTGEIRYLSYC